MRLAARTDRNHGEIVKAFRRMGCTVQSLATIGKGCPDLIVGMRGNRNVLVEIKDGNKTASQRKLTPDQERWHMDWVTPVYIVECLEDVIAVVRSCR